MVARDAWVRPCGRIGKKFCHTIAGTILLKTIGPLCYTDKERTVSALKRSGNHKKSPWV